VKKKGGKKLKNICTKHTNLYVPTFIHLYRFQEDNVGQNIWDKVRPYGEHVEKYVKNFENVFGT
jgi:hypothetical protein